MKTNTNETDHTWKRRRHTRTTGWWQKCCKRLCTIAICNGYLYVYLWKKGLFKIGTGVEGTIKGYLYQANVDFNPIKSYLDLKFHNSGGASSGNTTPEKNVANTGNKKSVGGSSSAGKKNKKMKNSSTSSLTPATTKLTTPPSNNNNNATISVTIQ